MIEFFFFGKPIKTLGSLGKIRVGRVTGNTHIFFFGLLSHQGPQPIIVCSNDEPWLTLTCFRARSNFATWVSM